MSDLELIVMIIAYILVILLILRLANQLSNAGVMLPS